MYVIDINEYILPHAEYSHYIHESLEQKFLILTLYSLMAFDKNVEELNSCKQNHSCLSL